MQMVLGCESSCNPIKNYRGCAFPKYVEMVENVFNICHSLIEFSMQNGAHGGVYMCVLFNIWNIRYKYNFYER